MGGQWRRALVAGSAAVVAWALLVEPWRVVVARHTLRLPRWPTALDGLRVAVVSDLHAGGPHVRERTIERIVERVNSERPDFVALLGDYVDPDVPLGRRLDPYDVAARLAALEARLGAVAILGNHDWKNETGRVVGALCDHGIPVLENRAVPVEGAAAPLWIAGLADLSDRHPDPMLAFSKIPEEAAVLALSHDPDVFPGMPDRAALTLAGHTHGGQVGLPLLRKKAAQSGYTGGHVVERGRHLYVSRGIGTSRLPIRFAAPPEVSVLTLRPL
jgi:predicted MPP superfamily phosphohydrolase